MEYSLQIKSNKVLIYDTTWMNLKIITLNKRLYTKIYTICDPTYRKFCSRRSSLISSDEKWIRGCLELNGSEELSEGIHRSMRHNACYFFQQSPCVYFNFGGKFSGKLIHQKLSSCPLYIYAIYCM